MVRLVASITPNVLPTFPLGEEDNEQGEFMVQCEICKAWQHGQCMHYAEADLVPNHYFCEECKPDLWVEVIKYVSSCPLNFQYSF